MPKTNDSLMISGAADYMINVHDVKLNETLSVCSCHSSRVKRLAVCPDNPQMYWSASEDGTIRYCNDLYYFMNNSVFFCKFNLA